MYGADDRKIGSVERLMIDEVSGQASYAALRFGDFLGAATITTRDPGDPLITKQVSPTRPTSRQKGCRERRNVAMTTIGTGRSPDRREQ